MKLIKLTLAVLLFMTGSSLAKEAKFIVDDPGGRNVAEFTSKAPIENVIGTTSAVTGFVSFDPVDLSKPAKANIKVDLTKVTTGIAMRDEHMRSKDYLNTSEYPEAIFAMEGLLKTASSSMPEGEPVDVTLKGKFTIHGVTRTVEVTGKATYLKEVSGLVEMGYPGDILNFDGAFTVLLNDYKIKRPQFLVLKLSLIHI